MAAIACWDASYSLGSTGTIRFCERKTCVKLIYFAEGKMQKHIFLSSLNHERPLVIFGGRWPGHMILSTYCHYSFLFSCLLKCL